MFTHVVLSKGFTMSSRSRYSSIRKHFNRGRGSQSEEYPEYEQSGRNVRDSGVHGSYGGKGRTSGGRGNGRHPPHLSGKDIGLWYASKGRDRANKQGGQNLSVSTAQHDQLKRVIDNVRFDSNNSLLTIGSQDESATNGQSYNHFTKHLSSDSPDNEELANERLKQDLIIKSESLPYERTLKFRMKLPVYRLKDDIVDTINRNKVVVISGETGCGKTTQVPQFILDDCLMRLKGHDTSIICTQPRRIAAISVAQRVADERNDTCGKTGSSVGYQIRLENAYPRERGSIIFCTPGILLKRLESDRTLNRVSHVILDEVHERELNTDFLLTILKDLVAVRDDLKVVVMSATLDANKFSNYFGSCAMFNIPGFTFPVKEYYLEDILELTGFQFETNVYRRPGDRMPTWKKHTRTGKEQVAHESEARDEMATYVRALRSKQKFSERTLQNLMNLNEDVVDLDLILSLLINICTKKPPGAILVFLTGWDAISDLNRKIDASRFFTPSRYLILPLHSMMPTVNQRQVFDRPPEGFRKIILATNIAETSITIDDVVYVIDSGKIKLSSLDVERKQMTLLPHWVSLANSHQRRGRAGRVAAGECFHVYTEYRMQRLEKYQLPEILRTRLEQLILQIKLLKMGDVRTFLAKSLDPPSDKAVLISIEFLQRINALDVDENLTALGHHLAQLPVDPQCGKMLLMAAIFSCFDPISTIAASLGFKDAFVTPLGKESLVDKIRLRFAGDSKSDHIMLSNAYKAWEDSFDGNPRRFCQENFLSYSTLEMLRKMKGQFAQMLYDKSFLVSAHCRHPDSNRNSDNMALVRAIVCAGLYPNIAFVTKQGNPNRPSSIRTFEDGKVSFHPKSINVHTPYFESNWIAYHTKVRSTGVFLHDTSMVTPYSLLLFGGQLGSVIDREAQPWQGTQIRTSITVDRDIRFPCADSTVSIVKDLRRELDRCLWLKIQKPEVFLRLGIDDDPHSALLQACIDLITSWKAT